MINMNIKIIKITLSSVLLCLLFSTYSGAFAYYIPVDPYFNADKVADAIPKDEPKSHYGNPKNYTVFGKKYHVLDSAKNYSKEGIASWYGPKFQAKKTSSGEKYDMYQMTAANKELPLPTYAQVTNLENGKSVIVKINDRGPFKKNRLIDLSYAAAKKLDMAQKGTAKVRVTTIASTTDYIDPTQTIPQQLSTDTQTDTSPSAGPAIELTRYTE